MARLVNYLVVYGVNSRHLDNSAGLFDKLKDAKAAYDAVILNYPDKAKRLVRLSYPDKWSGVDDVKTLVEVVA